MPIPRAELTAQRIRKKQQAMKGGLTKPLTAPNIDCTVTLQQPPPTTVLPQLKQDVSMRPDCTNGTKAIFVFCEMCGTVKVITGTGKKARFPDTGWWDECRACSCYRYFFRIKRGRVVRSRAVTQPVIDSLLRNHAITTKREGSK